MQHGKNTERVREDASGDSEDDELQCVIGESAGDCVPDYVPFVCLSDDLFL